MNGCGTVLIMGRPMAAIEYLKKTCECVFVSDTNNALWDAHFLKAYTP